MKKAIKSSIKKLVVFVLIIVMVTPTIVLGTDQPLDNLPVIEPYGFDPTMIMDIDSLLAEEHFLEVECTEAYDLLEQARINELLEEQRNMWRQDPYVQEVYRFYELANSPGAFSGLSEEDRSLIYRNLNIAEEAHRVASDLFVMMERNGHTLGDSIDLLIVMSSGLFNYEEAQTLIANIPNMIERNTEIMRFEQFVRGFHVPSVVNDRRLVNRPLVLSVEDEEAEHLRAFADVNSFVSIGMVDVGYSFVEQVQTVLAELGYDSGRSYGVGLDNTIGARPWVNEVEETPVYIATRTAISNAFTSENAFDVAHQMFLDNRGVAEIEAAFALGAALQVEPETFLLPANMYRAESAVLFADNGSDSIQAVAALSAGVNDLEPTPQPPTPPNAVHGMPSVMEHPFDVAQVMHEIDADAEELDYLIEYGMGIIGIAPMSAPQTPVHYNIVNNPFNLQFNANDSVNLNTGAAMFRTNVLSLPGRGGFGLNLDLVYNSDRNDLFRPFSFLELYPVCRYCGSRQPFFGYNCVWCLRQLHLEMRPILHHGVSHRTNPHGLGTDWRFDLPYIWDNLLHVPGRGTFELQGNTITYYTLQDMRLVYDNSFVSGNLRSTRRLSFHDGTTYYFHGTNIHSYLIGKRDRFNNTIRFEYTYISGWGMLLSRIIDTNDKHVNFNYQAFGDIRTITITGPDSSAYTINMSRLVGSQFALNNVRNQVGAVTSFGYEWADFYMCWVSKSPRVRHSALLLRQVIYPSGAQLHLSYGWRNTNFGRYGSRRAFMVVSRELFSGGRVYRWSIFCYLGDPTAFPHQTDRPPASHTYSTTITQNNGMQTVYTFNYRHLNTRQRAYGFDILLSEQTIAYNNDRLPISVTLTEHSNGFTRTNTQRFYYNQFGQVTTAVSPLAQGSVDARYRTITTYDNRFGLPLTTTFMSNATTTIRTVNRLSADGRSIAGTDIYENNVRMSRTNFLHDTHGNVTEIREFPNANGSDFITTQITYDRGTMPSSIRTVNVRCANNLLLGGTGIVERRFTYDAMWRVLSETDPMGYVTSWLYDRMGRVTRVTHPNGGYETYTYDDHFNTLTHRTVLGATYTHQFDGLGNLLTITDPSNTVILRNIYDNRMRLIETQNAQGIASSQRTTFIYDVFDRVTDMHRLNAAGGIMYKETTVFRDIHDVAGNSRIETTIHGCAAAPSIVNFAQHDRFGRLIQEGTIGGGVITYTHDLAGRVVTEQSLGIHNTFTYNIFGVTSVRNIEGNTRHNTYDSMGRLLTSSDFMGNVTRFFYDAIGRLLLQDTPFERVGNTINYARTVYLYDRNGNLLNTSRRINLPGTSNTWTTTVNTFRYNRLMSSQTGNGPLTEYTYDLAGNVLTKRVGGATTTFTYNNRGQLTRTTDALGQQETLTYDANGLPLTRTDRNGTLFRNTYDNMGRLVREEAVQNGVVTMHSAFAFTDTGAMRFSDTGSHAIWNYYDAQGRLILQAETDGITRTFAYNAASNITDERVYINGGRHYHNTYTFDIAQRMRTVTSGGQLQSTYNYNANGSRTSTILSNGVTTEYTRNVAGLVTRVVNRRGATVLSQFDYIYYLDGNTHQVVETMSGVTRTITYTYDTARRLTREHDTGAGGGAITRAYTFDNRSNRTQMVVTGAETYTVTSTHDLNNRLLTETRTGSNLSTTTFTYDRNGNQLTRTSGDSADVRTYNALNQLVRTEQVGTQQVTFNANGGVFGLDGSTSITETRTTGEALGNLPSPTRVGYELVGWYTAPTGGTRITESTILPGASTTATYTYRADGLRHSKTVNGVVTTHVWSRGQIVIERDAAGAMVNRYMRCLLGRLIRSDNHGWYLYNVRGDVIQRTDASGNVIAIYRYTAFGVELHPDAGNTNRFRFGGMYWDSHRSEYMTPNRMFNPRRGRWTQPDPFFHMRFGQARMMGSRNAIAQAGNLFAFTMNNPVRWIDPTGLSAQFGPNEHIIIPGGLLYNMLRESGQLPTQSQNQPTAIPTSPGFNQIGQPPPPRVPVAPPVSLTGSPGQTTFTHEDRFDSLHDVVLAFALTYHPQSYGTSFYSWIQRDRSTGAYMFSPSGNATTFQRHQDRCQISPRIGFIHTHPQSSDWWANDAREQFTGRYADSRGLLTLGDGHFINPRRIYGFLVTPSGVVRQLCYTWSYTGAQGWIPNDSPYVTVFIESIFER